MKQKPEKVAWQTRVRDLSRAIGEKWTRARENYLLHALLGLATTLIIIQLFPKEKSFEFADLKEGEIYIGEEIVAPFTFSINKTKEEYEKDVEQVKKTVAPVFVRNDSIATHQTAKLAAILDRVQNVLHALSTDSLRMAQLSETLKAYEIVVSPDIIDFFMHDIVLQKNRTSADTARFPQKITLARFRDGLEKIALDIYAIGLLNVDPKGLANSPERISVSDGSNEMVEVATRFYTTATTNEIILQKLRDRFGNDVIAKAGYVILHAVIVPNIFYDEKETNLRVKEAVSKVPLAKGTVLAKERIIDSNEKITREQIQKLRSLAEAKADREGSVNGSQLFFPWFGRTLIVVVALSFITLFLFFARRVIFDDIRKLLMTSISLLIVVLLAASISSLAMSEYFIPVALTAMLLTIFFDHEVAFMGIVSLAILLGGLRGSEYSIVLITFSVGTASILSVRRVRSRSWIFKSIVWVASSYMLTIAALELVRFSDFEKISVNLLYGLLNGFLTPLLVYGLMVILEYTLEMTTDATLLELSDLNKPLLRKLAMRAPGTYHHSILVGSLAEAAAEAIGANSLLARVGSYYHDIGKMDKPEYFVENQAGGKNPHDKLSPSMSCLILVSHVKRGLEIAEEHKLPREIKAFISEHHGTNLIAYFYHKAVEQSGGQEVSEVDFRYQGPKPQSKETGIVMLADAVEATSRSLKDPSVSRLRSMVNSIVDDRFKNCELDECPLTLRDLTQIQEAFVNILTGIFHGRIEYPDQDQLVGEAKSSEAPVSEEVLSEPTNGESLQPNA